MPIRSRLQPIVRTGNPKQRLQINAPALAGMAAQIVSLQPPAFSNSFNVGLGGETYDPRPTPIFGKITGGSQPYSWVLVWDDSANTWNTQTENQGGSTTIAPAYEFSGNTNVPVDAIVVLWPNEAEDTYYFHWVPNDFTVSSLTVTDLTTTNATITNLDVETELNLNTVTVTSTGTTWNYDTNTQINYNSVDINYNAGTTVDYTDVDIAYDADTVIDFNSTELNLNTLTLTSTGSTWDIDTNSTFNFTGSEIYLDSGTIFELYKVTYVETTTPGTPPPTGTWFTYVKADGTYWIMDDAGAEREIGTAGSLDEKAKISANDTTAGYLNGKLVASTDIAFNETNDGGNETLEISTTAGNNRPKWFKVTVGHADFTAAATSEEITAYTLPAKSIIHKVVVKHTTAFSGGGAAVAQVNISNQFNIVGDEYFTSDFDVFQAASNTVFAIVGEDDTNGHLPALYDFGSTTAIKVKLTSDVNVADLTAGSCDFYLLVSTLP